MDAWLGAPAGVTLDPGLRHPALLRRLLLGSGTGKARAQTRIAALALENEAEVVTFDRDFARSYVRHVLLRTV